MGKQNQVRYFKFKRNEYQHKTIQINKLKELAKRKVAQSYNLKNKASKISKIQNGKIFKAKSKKTANPEAFVQFLNEQAFQCPICLELLIESRLLQCGHSYCEKCIEELMIYKFNCGLCRNYQDNPEFQKDKFSLRLIEKIIVKKSDKYLDYLCRTADAENWKNARNVLANQLQIGLNIDFRDRTLKWRKVEISEIHYIVERQLYQFSVRYKFGNQLIIQKILSNSGRYAKYGFYTKMRYLELKSAYSPIQQNFRQQYINTPLTQTVDDLDRDFSTKTNEESTFQYSQNLFEGDSKILRNHQFQQQIENYLDFNNGLENKIMEDIELIEILI